MGLPSKKQLNKHRRGTRKALDTMDALNGVEKRGATAEKKKPKKAKMKATPRGSKPQSAANHKGKKPEQNKPPKTIMNEKMAEVTPAIELEQTAEGPDLSGGESPMAKPGIKLELDEREPTVQEKQPIVVQSKEPVSNQEAKTEKVKSEMNREIEDDQFDEMEEDTQKDRFLSFRIGKEDYGIEIKYVTEIIVMQKVTEVPDTPPYIKGVINLRGKVIPVMDVRMRFKLEKREYDERTCIIVVDVDEIAVGLIVDTVNEVVDIPEDRIDRPPAGHSGIEGNNIMGMGKVGKKVKILLDLENVLNLNQQRSI